MVLWAIPIKTSTSELHLDVRNSRIYGVAFNFVLQTFPFFLFCTLPISMAKRLKPNDSLLISTYT